MTIFGIPFVEDPGLVRGLDYYSSTVFEIITNKLGSQGTVLGGGRYDNLLKQLGDKDIPAFGFASGVERIMMLLEEYPKNRRMFTLPGWVRILWKKQWRLQLCFEKTISKYLWTIIPKE